MENPRILSPLRPYYLSLFLPIQFVAGWAQTPYQLRWQKEAVFAGVGAASLLTSYELGRRLTPLDVATVQTLNRQAVNAFDRGGYRPVSTGCGPAERRDQCGGLRGRGTAQCTNAKGAGLGDGSGDVRRNGAVSQRHSPLREKHGQMHPALCI